MTTNSTIDTTSDAEQDHEHEGGECPDCGVRAELRTCDDCGTEGWIIDCGHMAQPRPIAAGRSDGSEAHRTYCADCAEVDALVGKRVLGRAVDPADDDTGIVHEVRGDMARVGWDSGASTWTPVAGLEVQS